MSELRTRAMPGADTRRMPPRQAKEPPDAPFVGEVAKQVTQDVYDRTLELSRALGVRIARPRAARIAAESQPSLSMRSPAGGAKLSNDDCCYPRATAAARAIFDRKAGEAQSDIDLALLAAHARWDIELGLNVPIRWLAALAVSFSQTARNVASTSQLSTETKRTARSATAKQAARWLVTRGIQVAEFMSSRASLKKSSPRG